MLAIGRDILFVKLVEPHMVQKIGAVMIRSRELKDKFDGMTPAQIDKDLVVTKQNFNIPPNVSPLSVVLSNLPENIILTFVLAIIFTAIFRRERPTIQERVE